MKFAILDDTVSALTQVCFDALDLTATKHLYIALLMFLLQ